MACSWPLVFSVTGTVIRTIWWQVLLTAAYAGIVVFLYYRYQLCESSPEMIVPITGFSISEVLGVVTGMLLVFRTNTAYDRYWDGRGIWSDMVSHIRILTRTVWVMIDDKKDSKILVEKITLLNLLVAFAYSTKHYLREEYSRHAEDMENLVNFLPRLLIPSSNESVEKQENLSMASTDDDVVNENKKSKENQKPTGAESYKRYKSQPYVQTWNDEKVTTGNIPLEISCLITSFITSCKDRGVVDSPTCRILDTAVANIVRCLTGFEKIRRTPIPLAYCVHLTQITWIVVLMLPFQWVCRLLWYTIPATALASFALIGMLAIGREIENPFGYDYNDLNLDDFCRLIHKEVTAIISHPMPKADVWIFDDNNHPLIIDPSISAPALATMKYDELCKLLATGKGYKFHRSKSSVNSKLSGAVVETHANSRAKGTV